MLIKENKYTQGKISNFGTFYIHESPKKIGRNPITKEEFIIQKRKKLAFKASSLIKSEIN